MTLPPLRFLPPVDKLRALRTKLASGGMVDYWWMPEYRPEKRIKPVYAWAVGRLPILVIQNRNPVLWLDWSMIEKMSLADLRNAKPDKDGRMGMLGAGPKGILVVASVGEHWLSMGFYAGSRGGSVRPLESCIAHHIAGSPSIALDIEYPDGPSQISEICLPLEYLDPPIRVRRIQGPGGVTQALIVGFVAGQEILRKMGKIQGYGSAPYAACIGVTDEEPEALEQLEFFLQSYQYLYGNYVEPFIGQSSSPAPGSRHTFLSPSSWAQLDPANLPESFDDVDAKTLRKGFREAIQICGAKVDESSWQGPLAASEAETLAEAETAAESSTDSELTEEKDQLDDLEPDDGGESVDVGVLRKSMDLAITMLIANVIKDPADLADTFMKLQSVEGAPIRSLTLCASTPEHLSSVAGLDLKTARALVQKLKEIGGLGSLLDAAHKMAIKED